MTRSFGKLGFIHRRLWRDDGLYRGAFLCGPAAGLGALLALAVWTAVSAVSSDSAQRPGWAVPRNHQAASEPSATPQALEPDRPLPPLGPNGKVSGYEPGWRATLNPIEVSQTLDVDVKPKPLTAFALPGGTVDMAAIRAHAPPDALYVGLGRGFLAVKTAGVYAVTVRTERPAAEPANCLVRLSFGSRRAVSTLEVGLVEDTSKTFDAARFDLRPGLYPIGWAFGCWHGREVIGPGQMTLLIGHPGESTLEPARADDVLRPERPNLAQ